MPRRQGTGVAIWPDDIWHNVQSERRKLRLRSNPREFSGKLSVSSRAFYDKDLFSRRFLAECPYSAAISGTMPFLRGNI
jgi:hypothetical protein